MANSFLPTPIFLICEEIVTLGGGGGFQGHQNEFQALKLLGIVTKFFAEYLLEKVT